MAISEIVEGFLYIGAAKDTKDIQRMEKLGITHIVSCAGQVTCPERYKIAVEHFDDEENVDIKNQIDKAFWFIQKASSQRDTRVLVHCLAGKSRSVSIVLGYFLKFKVYSLKTIFYSVQSKRPEIRPNSGFMYQLLDLELELTGKESFSRDKKEWQSLVKSPPNSNLIISLNGFKGSTPVGSINLNNQINSTINSEFISIHLDKDTLNSLLKKHLETINQSQLTEYTFFCREIQQYLSESTNKAQHFTNTYYYIDWLDIVKYLENSIETLINQINK